MSHEAIISELKTSTNELKQLILSSLDNNLITAETEKKKSEHINLIVNHFHTILSSNFKTKQNFWNFISKHVNNPVARFCIIYEGNEINNDTKEENIHEIKGKNWILFSILEKSFYNSYIEIYDYLEEKGIIVNEKDILIKYKKEIESVLKELNNMNLDNILNLDYEKYSEFLDQTKHKNNDSLKYLETINLSPIQGKRQLLTKQKKSVKENLPNNDFASEFMSYCFFFEIADDEEENINISIDEGFLKEEKDRVTKISENFEFQKKADFGPSIVDNFYTFIPKVKSRRKSIFEDDKNSNIITNSVMEDELNNSKFNNCEFRRENSGLELHIQKKERHLPADKLYIIKNKTINKNEEILYNKKKTLISNNIYLYLTQYYQKAISFKFYNHNLHGKITSLKQQNYQCFICLHKFSNLLGFPIGSIFWCSYYMHFVCKNCIAKEYSIIPNLIMNHWCFEKFPISKKAIEIIRAFYQEPMIYCKKNDLILKRIPETVRRLKKEINYIFYYIKCDENIIIREIIGEYKYLALEENIFSLKDLLEIHNRTFIEKLKDIKNKLVKHIKIECQICKYEGNICSKCLSEEKIDFYDSENVIYEKENSICYHKICQNLDY